MIKVGVAALALAGAGIVISAAPAAAAAQTAAAYSQNPSDVLASNVRILASDPRNFAALVAAGRAALQTGDPQAAAGFFGRAEAINPNSYLPEAGMGAALVATGDAQGSMRYFARAQQLGANIATIGADRGLAYDLLGNQAAAQADYRAALFGMDRDEARRRLALSLAISGDKNGALTTLQPLLQQRDPAAQRARAFILALGGDISGAKAALDYMMPGASARMAPFFRRLPTLAAAQKAAAVHLGIFPEAGQPASSAYASATTPTPSPAPAVASASSDDRLSSIEQLLANTPDSGGSATPAATYVPAVSPQVPSYSPPVQTASIPRRQIQQVRDPDAAVQIARVASDPNERKIWLQLASGTNSAALPGQFRRIRSRDPSLFSGLSGYVANDRGTARLLIGPFHTREDARLFAEALSNDRIDSFDWTSEPNQVVTKLSN